MPSLEETADAIAGTLVARYTGRRLIAAVTGPPGSGRSTVAAAIAAAVNRHSVALAETLPTDGFALDPAVVAATGARPGSADAYDAAGLLHLLKRLCENGDDAVAVPVRDPETGAARAGARLIPRSVGVLVVEGDHLLVRHGAFARMAPLFDFTVALTAPDEILRRRLGERLAAAGFAPDAARRRIETELLPNGRWSVAESAPADVVLPTVSMPI